MQFRSLHLVRQLPFLRTFWVCFCPPWTLPPPGVWVLTRVWTCPDLCPLSFVLCPFTRTFPAPARAPAGLSGLPSGARLVGRPLRTRVCPHWSPHVTVSLGRGPAPCMLSQVCHTHPLGSGGGIAHAPPTLSILSSFSMTAFTVVPYSRFPKFTWFTEVPCFLPDAFFTFVTFLAHRGHLRPRQREPFAGPGDSLTSGPSHGVIQVTRCPCWRQCERLGSSLRAGSSLAPPQGGLSTQQVPPLTPPAAPGVSGFLPGAQTDLAAGAGGHLCTLVRKLSPSCCPLTCLCPPFLTQVAPPSTLSLGQDNLSFPQIRDSAPKTWEQKRLERQFGPMAFNADPTPKLASDPTLVRCESRPETEVRCEERRGEGDGPCWLGLEGEGPLPRCVSREDRQRGQGKQASMMASFYWCREYNFLLRSWERIRKSFTWPFVYGPFSCYCYCVLRAYSCALTDSP